MWYTSQNQAYTDYIRQIIRTEIITGFIMSVRISVCISKYQRSSEWTDCREIWYWRLLRKYVQERRKKNQLKSDKKYRALYIKNNDTKHSAARQLCNWNPQQNVADGDTQVNYTRERTVALHGRTNMLNYTHSVHFVRSAETF